MTKESIGFIGLGALGFPIAQNLLRAGYPLKVYNRTAAKAEPLVAQGARRVDSPAEVLTPGGIVVSLVFDGADLEEIVASEGFLEGLGKGSVHLVMSTIAPVTARKLADLHARHGCTYVDGPVFGRPEAAAARQLWSCVSGPAEAKRRVRPLLDVLAQGSFDFGERIGAATIVKLSGNFLIGAAAQAMSEALSMAKRQGVDPFAVIDMLTQTLFNAPIYRTYGQRLASDPEGFSFGNPIAQKDLGLFLGSAGEKDLPTPLARLLEELRKQN
jgi:3-hydroxyisobutyrate dehydrogenase-like beta-hydroxyacid dehydrogenase